MSVDELVKDIAGNMTNGSSADYIQLTEQLGIVGVIAEALLGLLVTIILIGIPLVVAVEVMYINFPVVQESFEKINIRTSGKINTALGLILRDARLAFKKANTVETGQSVNWIYFTIKVKAIFLAVLLAGLVLGAGPSLIQLVIEVAKTFIEGFREVF